MSHYTIEVIAEQDHIPVRGNACYMGDPSKNREVEDEILARLDRGDVWAWACVTVKVTCDDCEACGEDHLGACSYESEKDFTQPHGYYPDMVDAASEECRALCSCRKPVGVDAGLTVDR